MSGNRRQPRPAEIIIPDDVPPGLYILSVEVGYVNDQLLLILTRNTLMIKQVEGQMMTWVSAINGGAQADVDVNIYTRNGESLAQGRTDANGVFRADLSVSDPAPYIVIAQDSAADVTAAGLSTEWRTSHTRWWSWWEAAPQAQDYTAYIHTDRPIYKPGHRVYFKAILRRDENAVLSRMPANSPVTVRIRDPRNNVVQTYNVTTNDLGTVHEAFDIAEGAMLGNYAVEIAIGNETHQQVFKVEDHLPGGLEALNERLNTTAHVAREYEAPRYYGQDYGYNHKKVWGDRVSFFITDFQAGTRTLTYYARATHAGDFVALPTEVGAMYDATLWGRSASAAVHIAE